MKLGLSVNRFRVFQRVPDGGEVVGVVHVLHVPPIGGEARGHVLVEREIGAAFDGDVVAVVYPGEVAELEMARGGGRLRADPLHHVAVTRQHIDVVVEQLIARLVVAVGEVALRHRDAHGIAAALAERACGGLHAARHAVFGMAGRFAVHLAERFQVVDGERRRVAILVLVDGAHAGEMYQRIQQHRGRGRPTARNGPGSASSHRPDRS